MKAVQIAVIVFGVAFGFALMVVDFMRGGDDD